MMARRGMVYRAAKSAAEATRILSGDYDRLVSEHDPFTAAAVLMQAHDFFDTITEVGNQAGVDAKWLYERAEEAFYDHGFLDGMIGSMMYYQLAAGLDPHDENILWGVLHPCLQGSPMRPREALPYAVLLAHLNPERNEVGYVEKLIYDESTREQSGRDGEWLSAGGNNLRTGASTAIVKPPLQLVWRSKEAVNPKGGIVVGNGIAVCGQWSRGDTQSVIHAVDLADGSEIWSYPMRGMMMGWPAISGDNVYLGSTSLAICLDLATGAEVWKKEDGEQDNDFPVAVIGCPLCIGQMVVFSDDKSRGFHALTGEKIFDAGGSTAPRVNFGPCSDGTSLYLPGCREIMRIDLSDFKVAAHGQTDGRITAGPILAGGLVVLSLNSGIIEALNAQTLEPVWSFRIEDPALTSVGMSSACSYAAGLLFVGALDGNLYALEAEAGRRV